MGLTNKVAIIGAGNVGSTFAYSLMISGLAREIVLIDRDEKRSRGECMDLNHGLPFVPPVKVYPGDYADVKGAKIMVITAGAKQKEGETRLDLAKKNAEIFREIIPRLTSHNKEGIILVVSNPVDVLTYVSLKLSGFPSSRVIGSGTVLDSARLRYLISRHCRVDARNVHAYVIGEHGDTELPVWSHANIGGMVMKNYCPLCDINCDYNRRLDDIFDQVKTAAYKIIESKGATYYAIGMALVKIVSAVLRDENSVLPVSTLIAGYCGIEGVCLSLPAIVNGEGARKLLRFKLSGEEEENLRASAEALKKAISTIMA